MKFEPLFDRVLMKVAPIKENRVNGIIMPEDEQKQILEGTVIAVGDGLKDEPMIVSPGEMIIIQKFSGVKLIDNGEDYVIVKQKDILCKKKVD